MPIAIPVNPAGVNNYSPSFSTGSFSPPAGSLLVAAVVVSGSTTISNSGTARTWTQRKAHPSYGGVAIYTAPNPTALSNITVTATGGSGGLKVWVITGQHPTAYIGASGSGSTTTNNATINGYTSTGAGSRGFLAAVEWTSFNTAASSTDDEYAWGLGEAANGLCIVKATNSGAAGTNVQFNLDAAGTAAADWHWVALEILGASLDASADLSIVEVPVTTPAPSASAGAGASPDAVAVTATTPAPSVSTGAGAHPDVIPVTVNIPAPSVTLDETETVIPDTITVTTDVPAPAASAGTSVQLGGAVSASAAAYTPDVDAEYNASVDLATVAVTVAVDGAVAVVPVLPGDQLDGTAGQIEWNGFVLGHATPYRQVRLEGWRGKEPPDSGNAPRANRHGSAPGRPLARERSLMWTGFLQARPEDVEQAVLALENATPLLRNAGQWPIVINDLGTPYLAFGRIDRVHIPVDLPLRRGFGQVVLQWILAEPRRYGINATGVTVPIDEIVEITNAGNVETNPLLRIPGPVTTPKIHNLTLDRITEWNVTVPAGQELVIDTDLGTAKTYDAAGAEQANVIGSMSSGSVSVWDWVLDRGPQEIEFTAASGGSQVEVLYRDAWI